jgi:hypothetical protein
LRDPAWLISLLRDTRLLEGMGLIKHPDGHDGLALQPGLVLHEPEIESRESYKCHTLIAREELCANGNRGGGSMQGAVCCSLAVSLKVPQGSISLKCTQAC